MSWQDFFQRSLFENHEMLLPEDRIFIYLIAKTDDYGLITTTIKKASDATNISYSTTQKIFRKLINKRCILKLQNGLYAPMLRITNKPKEEVNQTISRTKIDNKYISLNISGEGNFICPKEVMYYLRKNNKNK